MLRSLMTVRYTVLTAAMLWPLGLAHADEPMAPPNDAALAERIEQLARELDADEFDVRETATKALLEIGEPARKRLIELADDPPSPEVKVRAGKILWALDLAELKRNAVKLDDLFEQVRLANAGKLDGEKFELLLERLIVVLREATGNDALNSPVKLADVKPGAADTMARNALIVMRRGRISFVRDSIVLADVAVDISSAENSIIIARAGASVSSVRNSIVIAGYDVRVSSARNNSILLSGGVVDISSPERVIIGAGEEAQVSFSREELVLVNTAAPAERAARVAPKLVKTDGLILRNDEPAPDNPLADKITVTGAGYGDIVLFRRNARGGELVARVDKPIEHPDGGILPETEGWQVCYTGLRSRGARVIFTNGERFVTLPVVRP